MPGPRPGPLQSPGHRPPGTGCGLEGGSSGRGRAAGDGFCGAKLRPPRPGGGEERHRAARGRVWGTGPPPGQQIRDLRGGAGWGLGGRRGASDPPLQPPPGPRLPETAGTLTWRSWATRTSRSPRCLAWSHRSSCCRRGRRPPLPAPRRPAAPLRPGPLGPTHCAPAARAPLKAPTAGSALRANGAAGGPRSPPACGEAGPWWTSGWRERSGSAGTGRLSGNRWPRRSHCFPLIPQNRVRPRAPLAGPLLRFHGL